MTEKGNPDERILHVVEAALRGALVLLKREFDGGDLYEVRLEIGLGERTNHKKCDEFGVEKQWTKMWWRVQVNNESRSDDSLKHAIAKLRADLDLQTLVPDRAARVAAILREIPDEGFSRQNVIDAAQLLLEEERRGGTNDGSRSI